MTPVERKAGSPGGISNDGMAPSSGDDGQPDQQALSAGAGAAPVMPQAAGKGNSELATPSTGMVCPLVSLCV